MERERRWLLRARPAPEETVAEVEITDVYFPGTRLRLRRMVDSRGGGPTIYKLTQKASGLVTNTYLAENEYQLLRELKGHVIRKVRFSVPPFGVDVFLPPLDGLVLAEAEFDSDEAMAAAPPPTGAIAEVTDDERFTGGRLARTSAAELAGYLAEFSSRSKP